MIWHLDAIHFVALSTTVFARLMGGVAVGAVKDIEVSLMRIERFAVNGDLTFLWLFTVAGMAALWIGVRGCGRRGAVAGLAIRVKARNASRESASAERETSKK